MLFRCHLVTAGRIPMTYCAVAHHGLSMRPEERSEAFCLGLIRQPSATGPDCPQAPTLRASSRLAALPQCEGLRQCPGLIRYVIRVNGGRLIGHVVSDWNPLTSVALPRSAVRTDPEPAL